jgi:hypothetical protein
MKPILSYGVTLILMGVSAMLLHQLILWLGVGDLVALLFFAAPISAYLAYCTHHTIAAQRRASVQIYASFCLVLIASAGLVYVIG